MSVLAVMTGNAGKEDVDERGMVETGFVVAVLFKDFFLAMLLKYALHCHLEERVLAGSSSVFPDGIGIMLYSEKPSNPVRIRIINMLVRFVGFSLIT